MVENGLNPDAFCPPVSMGSFVRYSVLEWAFKDEKNHMIHRPIIVQRNGYGMVMEATHLHCLIPRHSVLYNSSSTAQSIDLYSLCSMLNYIIYDNHEFFHADSILDISYDMMQQYFQHYAVTDTIYGEPPHRDTVTHAIRICTGVMGNLAKTSFRDQMHVTVEELYNTIVTTDKHGRKVTNLIPNFHVTIPSSSSHKLIRDIPRKVMPVVWKNLYKYGQDIAFGCACGMFAGLRIGEVCNLRQDTSIHGGNIRFTYIGGMVVNVEFHIDEKFSMRDENEELGGIKKPRVQDMFADFIPAFMQAYWFHMRWLESHSFDPKYAPMLVDSNGNAMTTKTFRRRLNEVVQEHIVPELLASNDPELNLFGQKYALHGIDPHAFRHVFSTELTLRNCDLGQLMHFRGDTSPESAFTYLQNKHDLRQIITDHGDSLMKIALSEVCV